MFTAKELRQEIIQPVLEHLDIYSLARENVLFGTGAHESKMGRYLQQIGGGPALGLYQMEPATYRSIWLDYLIYKPNLTQKILAIDSNNVLNLLKNPRYATAMAAIKYLWAPGRMPEAEDIEGLAKYWKKYYNTELGKGTVDQWITDYNYYEKETC